MPAFLIQLIISFVLKFGIPALVAWIKKRWGIDVLPSDIQKIVEEHVGQQKALHADTTQKLKACVGVACPDDVKPE